MMMMMMVALQNRLNNLLENDVDVNVNDNDDGSYTIYYQFN